MKRIPVLWLALALCLSLCACGGHTVSASTLDVEGLTYIENHNLPLNEQGAAGLRFEGRDLYVFTSGQALFTEEGLENTSLGPVVGYVLNDWLYVYLAEVEGLPDGWYVEFEDDGSGTINKRNVRSLYKSEEAEVPEWLD